MKKRVFASLLALCLCVGLLPTVVLAEGETDATGSTTQSENSIASVTQTTEGTEKTTYYDTLAAAVAAAKDGGTVTLLYRYIAD